MNRTSRPSLFRTVTALRCGAVALVTAVAMAATAGAQTQSCGGFVASDAGSVRLVDLNGNQVFQANGFNYPWTQVALFGPRLVVSDQAGIRILDRTGLRLGNVLARLGIDQSLVLGNDRVVAVDDDRVRIVDREGRTVGAPILKTGPNRQRAHVTKSGNVVVVDDDRVRIFNRDGMPASAPILNPGAGRQTVQATPSGLVIVTDDQGVQIFDENGVPRGAKILTRGPNLPTVTCGGGRVVVTDDQGTRIFGEDGTYKAEVRKTGEQRQQVVISGDRIITIDDDRVQVSDLDGFPVGGPVINGNPGQGRQTVTVTDDRIIITDGGRTQIFDKRTMALITTIARVGLDRQQVVVDGDRIIIVEQDQTRVFGSDGVMRGAPVQRSGLDTQSVRIRGNTILIIDTDRVRVFDRTGALLRDISAANVREYNVQLFDALFTLTSNDGWVEIRNGAGVLQGQRILVSPAVQHVQVMGDRVLVVDNGRMKFFTRAGAPVGNVVQMTDPHVQPLCWRAGALETFGQGCGAAGRVPQLTASGEPLPGADVSFVVQGARPQSPAILGLGLSRTTWNGMSLPVDLGLLGASGCRVLAAMQVTFTATTGSAGDAELPLRLPPHAAIVGAELFAQAFVLDAAANALGLSASNGARVLIGDGE